MFSFCVLDCDVLCGRDVSDGDCENVMIDADPTPPRLRLDSASVKMRYGGQVLYVPVYGQRYANTPTVPLPDMIRQVIAKLRKRRPRRPKARKRSISEIYKIEALYKSKLG